jgi:hypothetical protein
MQHSQRAGIIAIGTHIRIEYHRRNIRLGPIQAHRAEKQKQQNG